MKKEQKLLLLLTVVFITSLVISNVITVKLISVLGLVGPAGILAYSITFCMTDTIAELYGRATAQYVVLLGFIGVAFAGALTYMAVAVPSADFWENQSAFESVLGSSPRIVIACFCSYFASQTYDVWCFHFLKRLTNGKMLWLRNNGSTMISQAIDTSIFVTIAFWGTGAPLLDVFIGNYLLKVIVAALDTPIVYLMVYKLKPFVSYIEEDCIEEEVEEAEPALA
jgi:hypothetical protein